DLQEALEALSISGEWGGITGTLSDQEDLQSVLDVYDEHVDDTNNPHETTAAQVNAVSLSGDESIADVKTFTSFPVLPSVSPTTDYQATHKKYKDKEMPSEAALILLTKLKEVAGGQVIFANWGNNNPEATMNFYNQVA